MCGAVATDRRHPLPVGADPGGQDVGLREGFAPRGEDGEPVTQGVIQLGGTQAEPLEATRGLHRQEHAARQECGVPARHLRFGGELAGLRDTPLPIGLLAAALGDLGLMVRDVRRAGRDDREGGEQADGCGREPPRRPVQADVLAVEVVLRPAV